MLPQLRNPVYHSLLYNDAHLGDGTDNVKWFDEEVSPFAGFKEDNQQGFQQLYDALPAERKILFATPVTVTIPDNWKVMAAVEGLQFLYDGPAMPTDSTFHPIPLTTEHVEQMLALVSLTKPGPFGKRTIEFGHYYGVIEKGKLVAMTGQRLHVHNFTEISAVCTHPNHLGKGYATALLQHQMNLILQNGQIPFLHVRADNERAIAVYERLGFIQQGPMNFYFLRKV